MSLITCPECKNEISSHAPSCPKCGLQITPSVLEYVRAKKENKEKKAALISLFLFFGSIGVLIYFSNIPRNQTTSNTPPTPVTPEEAAAKNRNELISKGFDAWDGSHTKLVKIVKEAMNNPDSFKHVETKYGDRGDYLMVKMIYRGTNAFGGVVKNTVTAKCSLDGEVQEIISNE